MKKSLLGAIALMAGLGISMPAQAAIMFETIADGSNFPTPIATDAFAVGKFTLSDDQTQLFYDIKFNGIEFADPSDPTSEGITKIHLHATDIPGFHVLNITGPADDADLEFQSLTNPIQLTGIWDDGDSPCPADLTDSCYTSTLTTKPLSLYIQDLLNGTVYLNVHTTAWPSGELRGYLLPVQDEPPEVATTPEPGSILGLVSVLGLAGLKVVRKREN